MREVNNSNKFSPVSTVALVVVCACVGLSSIYTIYSIINTIYSHVKGSAIEVSVKEDIHYKDIDSIMETFAMINHKIDKIVDITVKTNEGNTKVSILGPLTDLLKDLDGSSIMGQDLYILLQI